MGVKRYNAFSGETYSFSEPCPYDFDGIFSKVKKEPIQI